MKKIIFLLLLAFSMAGMGLAQTDSQRTVKTKVIDAMAKLPAQNEAALNSVMQELLQLTQASPEAVETLADMMNQTPAADHSKETYAINGLSYYAMAPSRTAGRAAVAKAYMSALSKVTDSEVKRFFIRQLQIVGKEEAVAPLSALLKEEAYCASAARALATLALESSSSAAKSALINALQSAPDKQSVIQAIGEAGIKEAEPALLKLNPGSDANLKKVQLYALSQTGSAASMKYLAAAAAKTGFTIDNTGATESYINFLSALAANGDTKNAAKGALALFKNAGSKKQVHAQIAALTLLSGVQQKSVLPLALSALGSENASLRNAALQAAGALTGDAAMPALLARFKKADPALQADMIYFFADKKQPEAMTLINGLVSSANPDVRTAAISVLSAQGGPSALPTLIKALNSKEAGDVEAAKTALLSFKGDITPALAAAFESSSETAQVAILEMAAQKKPEGYTNELLSLIMATSGPVQAAALKALPAVTSPSDWNLVANYLESAPGAGIAPAQAAVLSALAGKPKAEQAKTVLSRIASLPEGKKNLYLGVLAQIGDPSALPILIKAFNQGSGEAKKSAFDALTRWNGPEAALEILNICAADPNSEFFTAGINGVISQISGAALSPENKVLLATKALGIAKTDAQKNRLLTVVGNTKTVQGLLLAMKYIDQPALQQAAVRAVMNNALANPSFYGPEVTAALNKTLEVLQGADSQYEKEAIRKHLADGPKEGGFVSLFNGKDLSGWKGLVANPIARSKMTPQQLAEAQKKADEVMRNGWEVVDGMLVFKGKGDNLCTEKQYGDFELYVDWMLYPDTNEADAGIYLRGTPQVQIWDTARVNVGAQVGSGGLYNNQKNPSKPSVVADNKLGEWNTFYIKMEGESVTVLLNGVKVVDKVILENYWNRNIPIFPKEQIELQAHGTRVAYRNLYVREIPRPEPFQLSAEEQAEGYAILFDGTNLFEWTGNTTDYVVEKGTISLYPGNGGGGNLYTKKEYKDFIFRFAFQLTPGANNGLGIRSPLTGDAAYVGMELQILDNEDPIYKNLEIYQYHGSVYGVIPAKRGFLKPVGEWNEQEVYVKGNHIKITLNGTVILDGDIAEASKNGTLDKRDHPGLKNEKGHIAFLGHGNEVKFKNIRIKEL